MSYTKEIVCLANSRKIRGYCVAGKEVVGAGYGGWIRPVSARDTEEILEREQMFADGGCPQILDVVTIPMMEPKPAHHQRENHLIDSAGSWEKIGDLDNRDLPALLDDVSNGLWINEGSSRAGHNDRVSIAQARRLKNSLLLIQPQSLTIIVQWGARWKKGDRPEVRADFEHNKHNYRLKVTDPVAEDKYQSKGLGEYSIATDDVYLCVSLAEALGDNCYKLVAAIIGDD